MIFANPEYRFSEENNNNKKKAELSDMGRKEKKKEEEETHVAYIQNFSMLLYAFSDLDPFKSPRCRKTAFRNYCS